MVSLRSFLGSGFWVTYSPLGLGSPFPKLDNISKIKIIQKQTKKRFLKSSFHCLGARNVILGSIYCNWGERPKQSMERKWPCLVLWGLHFWGESVDHCILQKAMNDDEKHAHWSLKAKGCFQKYLNGRLHAKERSWKGLQFGVCGNNISWRKHQ